MQCKILVVSSESEARSDMRESREVTWELEEYSIKVMSDFQAVRACACAYLIAQPAKRTKWVGCEPTPPPQPKGMHRQQENCSVRRKEWRTRQNACIDVYIIYLLSMVYQL